MKRIWLLAWIGAAIAADRDFWASRGAWAWVVSRIEAWSSCMFGMWDDRQRRIP